MIFLVASPSLRLDAIRDLKAAGYGASAPTEDEQGGTGYTLVVGDAPADDAGRLLDIVRAVDPSATSADRPGG